MYENATRTLLSWVLRSATMRSTRWKVFGTARSMQRYQKPATYQSSASPVQLFQPFHRYWVVVTARRSYLYSTAYSTIYSTMYSNACSTACSTVYSIVCANRMYIPLCSVYVTKRQVLSVIEDIWRAMQDYLPKATGVHTDKII